MVPVAAPVAEAASAAAATTTVALGAEVATEVSREAVAGIMQPWLAAMRIAGMRAAMGAAHALWLLQLVAEAILFLIMIADIDVGCECKSADEMKLRKEEDVIRHHTSHTMFFYWNNK